MAQLLSRSGTHGANTGRRPSAARDRRLSLSDISSARDPSGAHRDGASSPCGVRLTILKSPTSSVTRSNSRTSIGREDAPSPSPLLFTTPLPPSSLDFPMFGLPDLAPVPTRSSEGPLPALPNKLWSERQVWDQLGLSVAPASPQVSPYSLDQAPLPGSSAPMDIQGVHSPPLSSPLPTSLTSAHSLPVGDLQPVNMQELPDDIILPYRDRPVEIGELMTLSGNEHIFSLVRDSLPDDPIMGTEEELPVNWTWNRFLAHLHASRDAIPDEKWIADARACLQPRGACLYERFRSVLGIDLGEVAEDAEGGRGGGGIDIEGVYEGDAIVTSAKATAEVQRHQTLASPPQPSSPASYSPRSTRHHNRTRSGGSSMSRPRSLLGMSAISEDASESDGDTPSVQLSSSNSPLRALTALRSPSLSESQAGGRPMLGLRVTAGPPSARSASRSLSRSTARSEVGSLTSDMARAFDGFSDEFALHSDDDEYHHDTARSPYGPPAHRFSFTTATDGPALPDLSEILSSGLEAAVASASKRSTTGDSSRTLHVDTDLSHVRRTPSPMRDSPVELTPA